MATVSELGQRVKSKYPGQYDDIDDAEVGRRVKSKFPGQYDDFSDEPKYGTPPPVTGRRMSKEEVSQYVKPLPKGAEEKQDGGFFSGLADTTIKGIGGAISGAYNRLKVQPNDNPATYIARNTVGPYVDLAKASVDQYKQADDLKSKGRTGESISRRLGAIPVVGPMAAGIADTLTGRPEMPPELSTPSDAHNAEEYVPANPSRAAGQIAGAALPMGLKTDAVAGTAKRVAAKLAKKAESTGEGIYQSLLKPSTTNTEAENAAIVKTGTKERIPLSKGGRQKLRGKIDSLHDVVDETIDKGEADGLTVDPKEVAKYADRSKAKFANQVDPQADLNAVEGVRGRFLDRHSTKAPYSEIGPVADPDEAAVIGPFVKTGEGATTVAKPIPVRAAQAEKQGTYAQLRGKYGELGSAEIEAQKDLARGLKDQTYKILQDKYGVDLASLGKNESALIDLDSAVERFINRHGNNQSVGIGPGIHAAGVGAVTGNGFLAGAAAIANYLIEKNPNIGSRVAIGLANRRFRPIANAPRVLTSPASRGMQLSQPPELDSPQQ